MGHRARRYCSASPTCRTLTNGGPCAFHERQRDQARGSAADRGYTPRWSAYSKAWLARFPWCGQRRDGKRYAEHSQCTADARLELATCTDHIRAIAQGGPVFDPANHQSLCGPCNRRKAIAHEGGFARVG